MSTPDARALSDPLVRRVDQVLEVDVGHPGRRGTGADANELRPQLGYSRLRHDRPAAAQHGRGLVVQLTRRRQRAHTRGTHTGGKHAAHLLRSRCGCPRAATTPRPLRDAGGVPCKPATHPRYVKSSRRLIMVSEAGVPWPRATILAPLASPFCTVIPTTCKQGELLLRTRRR